MSITQSAPFYHRYLMGRDPFWLEYNTAPGCLLGTIVPSYFALLGRHTHELASVLFRPSLRPRHQAFYVEMWRGRTSCSWWYGWLWNSPHTHHNGVLGPAELLLLIFEQHMITDNKYLKVIKLIMIQQIVNFNNNMCTVQWYFWNRCSRFFFCSIMLNWIVKII